jgi:hypothetical protein
VGDREIPGPYKQWASLNAQARANFQFLKLSITIHRLSVAMFRGEDEINPELATTFQSLDDPRVIVVREKKNESLSGSTEWRHLVSQIRQLFLF